MDESVKIGTLSMETGVLVDRNRKHVRLSMESGVLVDRRVETI